MGQSASQGRNVAGDEGNDADLNYMSAVKDDSNHRPQVKGKDRKGHRRSHTSNSAAEDGWASGSASEESEADADVRGLYNYNALDPANGGLDHVNYLSNTHVRNMVTATVGLHSTYITTPNRRPAPKTTPPRFQFKVPSSFNTDGSSSATEKNKISMANSTFENAGGGRIVDNPSLLEKGLAGNTQPTKTSHFPLFRGFLKGNNRVSHEERPSFSFTPVPLHFHDPARPYTAEQLATRPPLLPASSVTAAKSREHPERLGGQKNEGTVFGQTGNDGRNSRVGEQKPSTRSSSCSSLSSAGISNLGIADTGGTVTQPSASTIASSPLSSSSSDPINHPTDISSAAQNSILKRTKRDLESTLASPAARNRDMRGRWSADSTSTSSCARIKSPCSKLPRYSAKHPDNCPDCKLPEPAPNSYTQCNVESVDGENSQSDTSACSSTKRTGDRLSRRRRLSVESPEQPVSSLSRPARPVNRTMTQQPILDPAVVNMKFDFAVQDEDSDDILTSANHTSIPRSADVIDIDRSDDEERYENKESHALNLPRLLDDSEDLLRKQLRRKEQQRSRQLLNHQQARNGNAAPHREKHGQPNQKSSDREASASSQKGPVPSKQPHGRTTGKNKSTTASEANRGNVISASQPNATGAPSRKSDDSTAEAAKRGKPRIAPKPATPPPISPTPKSAGSLVGRGNQARKTSSPQIPTPQQESNRRNEKKTPGPPPSPPPPTQPIKDPVSQTSIPKTGKRQPETRTGGKGAIPNTGRTEESKQGLPRKPSVSDEASAASKKKANVVSNPAPKRDPSPAVQGASVKGSNKGNKNSPKKVPVPSEAPLVQGAYIGKGPRAPFALRRRRFLTIKPTDWVCAFCDYEHSLWLESAYSRIQKSIKKKQKAADKARKAGTLE